MSADGSDDRTDDEFVATYEDSTPADIIEEAEPATAEDDDEDGAVAGSFSPEVEVTPQAPTPENTLFVAIGIYLTVIALADTILGLGPVQVIGIALSVAAVTLVSYGILVRTTPDT
jgi:hypothetical protein